MGNEQFTALMKGFNTLNKYVRLLSVSRGPHRNVARAFQEKVSAQYASFKKRMEDPKLTKAEACFFCVESKILKAIDDVMGY